MIDAAIVLCRQNASERGNMTKNPLILVYNFKPDERTRLIRRYLNKEKISFRMVEVPEFWQPLGYLAGLSGFQKDTSFHLGGNFFEEMLVMCGLFPRPIR